MSNQLKTLYFSCSILQPHSYMENAFSDFYGPAEPLDSKIFSPFNLQMMNELGSSYLHSSTTFSNDNKGVQLQDGTNSVDIDEFLDSLLVSSNEYSYENSGAVEQGFVKESGQVLECNIPRGWIFNLFQDVVFLCI